MGPGRHYLIRTIGGRRASVKVYNRRAGHGLLRRMRPGRSILEAAGYFAFAQAGLPTARLLVWAEERRAGLWQRGVIATELVDAPTVAEAAGAQPELIEDAARLLARIHRAGLAHGDARTRNFLATREGVVAFDLEHWAALGAGLAERDLADLLGSALRVTADEAAVVRALAAYAAGGGAAALTEEDAVAEARAWAAGGVRP